MDYVDDVGFGFHSVQVSSMQLGSSQPISVGASAILDTGTNVLLAPSKVMSALQTSMCASSSPSLQRPLGKCVDLTDEQVSAYPPLSPARRCHPRDVFKRLSPPRLPPRSERVPVLPRHSRRGLGGRIRLHYWRHHNEKLPCFHLDEKKIGWGKVDEENCGSI